MSFFVIQGRPVSKKNTWGAARTQYGARIYQTNKSIKTYCEAARIQVAFQAKRQGFTKIAKPEKVAIRFKVFFGKHQGSMDVHNAIETLLDALQGACYDNDNQVVGNFHPPERFVDDERPRIEFEIQTQAEAKEDVRWRSP